MSEEISNNKVSNSNFWYLVLEICDLFKLRFLFPFGINYNYRYYWTGWFITHEHASAD